MASFDWDVLLPKLEEALLNFGGSSLRAVLIITLAHFGLKLGARIIDRLFEGERDSVFMEKERVVTLGRLLKNILRYSVDAVAFALVVQQFVDITPLLAGAGIAGLAIGFGAQNLVRDVITGFFLLWEDQFRVGEYIKTAGVSGVVDEFGFRITKIRDFGGQIHIIPNGAIEQVTNFSRGNQRVMFDVGIAYEEDIDRAMEVLREMCVRFRDENEAITDGPEVLGVTELGDSSVNIRLWAMARPGEQWAMERALRRAAKYALDEAGIEIPYPRQVQVPIEATKVRAASGADGAGGSLPGGLSVAQDSVERSQAPASPESRTLSEPAERRQADEEAAPAREEPAEAGEERKRRTLEQGRGQD